MIDSVTNSRSARAIQDVQFDPVSPITGMLSQDVAYCQRIMRVLSSEAARA